MENLIKLRNRIVSLGKQSKKFRQLGAKKGRLHEPKYGDPSNLDKSGAISGEDAQALYAYVAQHGFKKIWEIGTWFGTSAYVMLAASPNATIWTCDKHDVFVALDGEDHRIQRFPNCMSTKFLEKISDLCCDFVFADAELKRKDVDLIVAGFDGPVRFATHDYEDGKKGKRNISLMKKALSKQNTSLKVYGALAILEET